MKTNVAVSFEDAVRIEVVRIGKNAFGRSRILLRTQCANEKPVERWLSVNDSISFAVNANYSL